MVAKEMGLHYVELQMTQSTAGGALYEQAQAAAKSQQLGFCMDVNPNPYGFINAQAPQAAA